MNRRQKTNSEEISGHWKPALRQAPTPRAGISAPASGTPSGGKIIRDRSRLVRRSLVSVFFILFALILWAAFGTSPTPDAVEPEGGTFTLDRHLEYKTDGMIPESYIRGVIGESSRMPPIFDVKRKLEAIPQVRSVSVRRLAGDRLAVGISERRAVARFNGLLDGRIVVRLVSSEGVIYEPIDMREMNAAGGDTKTLYLRNIPVLSGFSHVAGPTYDYIEGFEPVAAFLDLARERYPQLYRDWQMVSLRDYRGRPEALGALIRVKPRLNTQEPNAAALKEILFSPIDYAVELSRMVEYDVMNQVRATLRNADSAKYPAFILDMSMVNASNPRYTYLEPRVIPVPAVDPAPPRSR